MTFPGTHVWEPGAPAGCGGAVLLLLAPDLEQQPTAIGCTVTSRLWAASWKEPTCYATMLLPPCIRLSWIMPYDCIVDRLSRLFISFIISIYSVLTSTSSFTILKYIIHRVHNYNPGNSISRSLQHIQRLFQSRSKQLKFSVMKSPINIRYACDVTVLLSFGNNNAFPILALTEFIFRLYLIRSKPRGFTEIFVLVVGNTSD